MTFAELAARIRLPADVAAILRACPKFELPASLTALADRATGPAGAGAVVFDVPGKGPVHEADVCKTRNGIVVNYPDPYMRRRDPDCMVIGDDLPTNKPRYIDRFGGPFETLRQQTFAWLATQELLVVPFSVGMKDHGVHALALIPANAAFFAFGLALLQGMLTAEEIPAGFAPKAVVYLAPPFRHTHFAGKQMVVHNRTPGVHELFSYNLYPGPSAKKGIYGVLLNLGEQEGWVTAHCSTVQVVTPYDNVVTFMHEGASGGGKSEMLEMIHREYDGRLLLGANTVTRERRYLVLPRGCELHPVTDDMALCHPALQGAGDADGRKLSLVDAETSWFVRVNHIDEYGVDPALEKLTIDPREPLLFLSIDAVPHSRALIWEHTLDAPGKRCPNPRVVIPRRIVPNVVDGPVTIDIRSFGVRMPPCTSSAPTYGIAGILHLLPPALAWLWRLVAPRGHENPSIAGGGPAQMASEGVGSYWPFATGRRVDQANLLLEQIQRTTRVRYILCPNQHVGAWKVSFMPQWLAREYLARRGNARFKPDQVEPARCPLLGYTPRTVNIEGSSIPPFFLRPNEQPEIGPAAYDQGAEILQNFFRQQLWKFRQEDDLLPLGKQIIDACLDHAPVTAYEPFIRAE